jgi:ubiquinone/menaquinone biosynthesis C-methylase UbiE
VNSLEQCWRPPANERWLDVGCGTSKVPGALGLDIIGLDGVDIVHDLEMYPWPFPNDDFDHIVCRHSLSHLDDLVACMEEIHRIAKPGAVVEIIAPHYASDNFNTDPTHKIHMGYRSMNYFCENLKFKYQYYSKARFTMLQRRLSFRVAAADFPRTLGVNPFRWIGLEQAVNRFARIYERFFVYWLPPSELYFKLRVIK